MNEFQERLWQKMIDLIDDYLNEKDQDFYNLVGQLEGALDASEIEDEALINQWYELWSPLEITRATKGNQIEKNSTIHDLEKMKEFLVQAKNNGDWRDKL